MALAKSAALARQAVAVGENQLLVVSLDVVEGGGLQSAAQGLPAAADQGKVILLAPLGRR